MNFAERKYYYNRCKVNEPLDPGDERNVNFDDVAADERPRGEVWVERLANHIELADASTTCLLLTGLPGSGKSTELRRLAKRLQEKADDRAHLFPALIDAEDFVDLTNSIDIPDLIFGILYYTERSILEKEGKRPELAGTTGAIARIWQWLNTDIALKTIKLSVPAMADFAFEMKARPDFREQVRNVVSAHLSAFLQQAHAEIESFHQRVKEMGYSGLVIIVDSLEKLRGSSSNWDKVLESAEQVFRGGAPYLYLPPAHVIYTVPAALVARGVKDIEFMPMIKVREHDNERFQPGITAMCNLVWRRIPGPKVQELLGDRYNERIEEAILWSGGYPRELLRILQEMLKSSAIPIPGPDLERIYSRILDEYRSIVAADAFDWLAQVAVNKYPNLPNDDQRKFADRMLSTNAILRYINKRDWYDLHPAVREIPGVKDAIERLRQPTKPSSS